MRNITTVLRRELAAYFKSAIAYLFIIVFLLVGNFLYVWPFFDAPRADMRPYFGLMPLVLCIFLPAVTMRLWAEERKENTYEMLLTFPMKTWELVLGKFLAGVAFFAATLAATFTLPLMLVSLGNPDGPVIGSAYLGSLLLGSLFLAAGIFISGLFKDQIIAFVVALLACFALFLAGTDFVAAFLDGWIPGLGSLVSNLLGVFRHYEAFTKGVIEPLDVLFFAVWTALFLFLNGLYIDLRSRRGGRTFFATAAGLGFGVGLLFNWLLVDASLGRVDLTEDRLYTISDATKRILAQLRVPVQIKIYITPRDKMPTQFKTLERDVVDKLTEMRVASGGRIAFRAIHMEAANVLAGAGEGEEEIESKRNSIEARMFEKGVQPFSVPSSELGEFQQKLVYSSLGVAYKEKEEEIIPEIRPEALDQLEYQIVNTVYRLTRDREPVVALFAPDDLMPEYMRQMYMQMGQAPRSEDPYQNVERLLRFQKYDVRRVKLTHASPIPAEADALLIVDPRDLNDRQLWEIDRFLLQGKAVLVAAQRYTWRYQVNRGRISVSREEVKHGLNAVLEPAAGLAVDDDILMDVNHGALRVPSNAIEEMMGGGLSVKLPLHIIITQEGMNPDVSISRLDPVFYLWGTAVKIDDKAVAESGLKVTRLLSTSSEAWRLPASKTGLEDRDLRGGSAGRAQYPVAVMVEGRFRDAYKDKTRPAWPPAPPSRSPFGAPPEPPPPDNEPPAPALNPAEGKLILIGCAQMFSNRSLMSPGNRDLLLNCVDALTLSPDLVHVRSRKPVDRVITKPDPGTRVLWIAVNVFLVPAAVAAAGIAGWMLRRASRNAYTMRYQSV